MTEFLQGRRMLSRKDILSGIQDGSVIIEPFDVKNLRQNSYDVNIGKYYWKMKSPISRHCMNILKTSCQKNPKNPHLKILRSIAYEIGFGIDKVTRSGSKKNAGAPQNNFEFVIDPYSEDNYLEWTLGAPLTFSNFHDRVLLSQSLKTNSFQRHQKTNSDIILVEQNHHLLCYTEQFIGSTRNICPMMGSRSSTRRIGLDTCRDAGKGDIGYFNRWTMEVSNTTSERPILMVIGNRYSQITFYKSVSEVSSFEQYGNEESFSGKYQKHVNGTQNSEQKVLDLASSWNIYNLIPKKELDVEINEQNKKPTQNNVADISCDYDEVTILVYFLSQFLFEKTTEVFRPQSTCDESKNSKKNSDSWYLSKVLNYARSIISKEPEDEKKNLITSNDIEKAHVENSTPDKTKNTNDKESVPLKRTFSKVPGVYPTSKLLSKTTVTKSFVESHPINYKSSSLDENTSNDKKTSKLLDTFTEFCYMCSVSLYDDINFSIFDVKKTCRAIKNSKYKKIINEDSQTTTEINPIYDTSNNNTTEATNTEIEEHDNSIRIQEKIFYTYKDIFDIKSTSPYENVMRRNATDGWNIDNQLPYTNINDVGKSTDDNLPYSQKNVKKHNSKNKKEDNESENDNNSDESENEDGKNVYNDTGDTSSDNENNEDSEYTMAVKNVSNFYTSVSKNGMLISNHTNKNDMVFAYDPTNLRTLHSEPLEFFLTWRSAIMMESLSSLEKETAYEIVKQNVSQKIKNLKFFSNSMSNTDDNKLGSQLLNIFGEIDSIVNKIINQQITVNDTEGWKIFEKIHNKNFSIVDHLSSIIKKPTNNATEMTKLCIYVYLTTGYAKHLATFCTTE